MNTDAISFWADIAAVFLVINMLVLTIITGALFGFAWWYLRKGRKALVMPLLMAQVYTLRVQNATMKVTDAIASVPIQMNTTYTRVTTTTRVLMQSLARAIQR